MTPKLQSHILNPLFFANPESPIFSTSNLDFTIEPFEDERTIRFLGIVDESETPFKLRGLFYLTNLQDEELGLLDAIVCLVQERNVKELKELRLKEVDFYLRQDIHESSFKYYHDNHYKLLASLEKLALYIEEKKQIRPWLKIERDGPYESLPDFEKLDLVDEILARFIISGKAVQMNIWCEDVEDNTIYLNAEKALNPKEKVKVQQILLYHLQSDHLRIEYL